MKEEIMKEIEDLRGEVQRLSESLGRAKQEEIRNGFCEEMRRAVMDRLQEVVEPEIRSLDKDSSCSHKDRCIEQLRSEFDYSIREFAKGNISDSLVTLDRLRGAMESGEGGCLDDACTQKVLGMVKEVRILMSIFDGIISVGSSSTGDSAKFRAQGYEEARADEMDPEEVERALLPLSSRWRISILRVLSAGGVKFTDLSMALGLRTGHLQFHLRTLAKCGYITKNPKSKTYSISEKGRTALSWAEGFALTALGIHRRSPRTAPSASEPAPSTKASSAEASSGAAFCGLGDRDLDDWSEDKPNPRQV